ncbi:MAG: bifunctional diaminohydroxyphosphoribosylaminopyrimidine deaminase/5-amino-6-(5-phosphoribosylamino)uracil reductase RibD [Pseudomonadota bacterium]
MTDPATHDAFLAHAVRIARRGLGRTAPNPAVGALVVAAGTDGRGTIVGAGVTAVGGRPHAETQALEQAGRRARGATLYVSLEPCSHHGRTPPCADAVIDAGIEQVVCALLDPDARVAGRGFTRLERFGVDVVLRPRPDAALVAAPHTLRVRYARPHVVVKLAVSADDRIAHGDGAPVWVTGETARQHGHLLRARADAIMVGRGTVDADDPGLDCRLPGLAGRSPRPVVLASGGIDLTGKRLATRDPIICVADDVSEVPSAGLAVPRRPDGGLDVRTVLAGLAVRGTTSVLIEGGPTLAASVVADGLTDEIVLYRGADPLGEKDGASLPSALADALADRARWLVRDTLALGADTLTRYHRASLANDLMTSAPA